MLNTPLTLQAVLDWLISENLLSPDEPAHIAATLSQTTPETPTPWYIRGLIGIGGWVAALFFILFLGVLGIIDEGSQAIVVGFIFCLVAIGLKWLTRRSVFAGQLALAVSLAGQALFIGGLTSEIDNISITLLITILFEGVLLIFYPDKLHRFLSTLVICGAIFWLFIDLEIQEVSHLVLILLAVGTVLLWLYEARLIVTPLRQFYRPVGYALPVAMFGFLLLSFSEEMEIKWWWLSAGGLLLVLFYLEYLILRQQGLGLQTKIVPWLLAGTLILIIPAFQTPGILAALIGLLLGFQGGREARLLLGLSIAFLAVFLIGYYYNLNLTLLTKSFVLMGTGLIFLGLRYSVSGHSNPLEVER